MLGRHQVIGFGLALVASVTLSEPGQAQRVSADIHIGGRPISGTIHIGNRGWYPRPRNVAFARTFPRRIVLQRGHFNPRKARNGRVVAIYYDRDCDLYFDGYRRGLAEVRVYQDGNRYYRYDDRDNRRRDRDDRYDRDRDRRDRDRDDRDRRNDRDNDDYGAWEHDHR